MQHPSALYGRVSTEEQKTGKTIESQIVEIKQYALQEGYYIAEEYIDEAWSGSVLERPELDRLRSDIKSGKFQHLLIHHPDRLSRVQLHQLLLLDEFEKNNIKVVFVKIPEFSSQSEESRVVNKSVWSMVSELERLRIKERTRRGRRNKARKGLIVGGIPPYGYKYVKKNKDLKTEGYYKIDPEEAKIVRMIFSWAKQGISAREIVRRLTNLKIPTRKHSKRQTLVWARSTIHKVLSNKTYTGITYYDKYKSVKPINPIKIQKYRKTEKTSRRLQSKDKWIPILLDQKLHIVSGEDFDFVQKQIKKNYSFSSRNTKMEYLLRGLVDCGFCGCLYYTNSNHGVANYQCSNKSKKFPFPRTCQNVRINANVIEPLVWKSVKQSLLDPKVILKQARIYDSREFDGKNQDNKSIIDSLIEEEQRIIEAYKKGVIQLDQLENSLKDIKIRRLAVSINTEVKKLSCKVLSKGIKWLCKEVSNILNDLDFKDKRKILRLMVQKIILNKRQIIIRCVLPVYEHTEAIGVITPTTFS